MIVNCMLPLLVKYWPVQWGGKHPRTSTSDDFHMVVAEEGK